MKGTIRANLGASRYTVGIPYAEEPLASLKEEAQQAYEGAIQQRLEALKALAAAEEPYNVILAEIEWATASYGACRIEFDYSSRLAAALAICDADYSACYNACNPIEGESKPAEEIFACQKSCAAVRDKCHEQATIDTKNLEIEHLTQCQATWSPLIADLQTQALELMAPVRDAMYQLQTAEALELSTARRITELDQVAAVEQQITCWRAQYDDGLTTGTEVEVARTPSGRHVITEIYPEAEERCLQEARALPPKHLFVNAAVAPGFETWLPTWRVGVVKAIVGDKLQVEVQGGTMTGSLGTLYSRNPINCTPPQAYFDGNWQESEARIKAAREALAEAQEDKTAAVKDRDDCISQYDQTWYNACYTDKAALCDSTWATWLAECEALEGIDPEECLAQYQASLAACYAQSLADCDEQRDTMIAACREEWQPAVDAAAAVVAQATDDLQNQLSGIYRPADPLTLTLPVEHCDVGIYEVGDDVLIGFPERIRTDEPMHIWDAAAVYGWASNTRECAAAIYAIQLYYADQKYTVTCDREFEEFNGDIGTKYQIGKIGASNFVVSWRNATVYRNRSVAVTLPVSNAQGVALKASAGVNYCLWITDENKASGSYDLWCRRLGNDYAAHKLATISYAPVIREILEGKCRFEFSPSAQKLALIANAYPSHEPPFPGIVMECNVPALPLPTEEDDDPAPTSVNLTFTVVAEETSGVEYDEVDLTQESWYPGLSITPEEEELYPGITSIMEPANPQNDIITFKFIVGAYYEGEELEIIKGAIKQEAYAISYIGKYYSNLMEVVCGGQIGLFDCVGYEGTVYYKLAKIVKNHIYIEVDGVRYYTYKEDYYNENSRHTVYNPPYYDEILFNCDHMRCGAEENFATEDVYYLHREEQRLQFISDRFGSFMLGPKYIYHKVALYQPAESYWETRDTEIYTGKHVNLGTLPSNTEIETDPTAYINDEYSNKYIGLTTLMLGGNEGNDHRVDTLLQPCPACSFDAFINSVIKQKQYMFVNGLTVDVPQISNIRTLIPGKVT